MSLRAGQSTMVSRFPFAWGAGALGLLPASLMLLLLLVGCDRRDATADALRFLEETEGTQYEGEEVPQERIRELQQDIEEYEDDVEEVVAKLGEIAVFRKLLAEEFIDREMYGPALEHLEAALELQPANAVLYYLAGASSAQTAQAFIEDPGRQEEYLRRAEAYYIRALELDSDYRECLYAISVLYVYELEEPGEAQAYINRLLEIDPQNVSALFVRARMLVQLGQIDEAADLYGEIVEETNSRELRARALENRNQLLEGGN